MFCHKYVVLRFLAIIPVLVGLAERGISKITNSKISYMRQWGTTKFIVFFLISIKHDLVKTLELNDIKNEFEKR